ncbi:MAG: Abi family protein [Anaerolineales bacterium]|nr:Abi family protein [Anaerolineales bacterium]
MHYTKPALTFEEQAQLLLKRGLVADKNLLVERLSLVNYYRLSAYWYNFKRIDIVTGVESFAPNTTFDMIWGRYSFDRELRRFIVEALEHVEVAVLRTCLVEQFTLAHGPFGYVTLANFNPRFSSTDHARLLSELTETINRSKEEFIGRFSGKYTREAHLPLWMATEVMTFGQLFTMFRNLDRGDLQVIARRFNLYPPVMVSWLHTLLFIRNICAHHARLWNRDISIRPQIPARKHSPEWHSPVKFNNTRVFAVLGLLCYLMKYLEPSYDFLARLEGLLLAYPEIPIREMGFPSNWKDSSIWK